MERISKDLANLKTGTPTTTRTAVELPEETEETKEQKLGRLRRSLGLSSLDHTFEKFKHVPGTTESFAAFKALADGKAPPMLLVYGGVGNGKTYLCEALSIALYKQGVRCPVVVWSDLMRQFKRGMHRGEPGGQTYDEAFEVHRRRERLVMDDVGMGSSGSEWEWGELEDIVNYRYRERLFTVVATNKDLDELPERVTSRFSDPEVGRLVLNKGHDFRRRKVGE